MRGIFRGINTCTRLILCCPSCCLLDARTPFFAWTHCTFNFESICFHFRIDACVSACAAYIFVCIALTFIGTVHICFARPCWFLQSWSLLMCAFEHLWAPNLSCFRIFANHTLMFTCRILQRTRAKLAWAELAWSTFNYLHRLDQWRPKLAESHQIGSQTCLDLPCLNSEGRIANCRLCFQGSDDHACTWS